MSRPFSNKIFLILGVFLVVSISIPLINKAMMNYKIYREVEALKIDIKKLEGDKEKLISLKQYLESKDYIEREARLKLGLKKEDESTVVIQNLDKTLTDKIDIKLKQAETQETKSNPQKWLEYFMHP